MFCDGSAFTVTFNSSLLTTFPGRPRGLSRRSKFPEQKRYNSILIQIVNPSSCFCSVDTTVEVVFVNNAISEAFHFFATFSKEKPNDPSTNELCTTF